MNNADMNGLMPAMPLSGDAYQDFAGFDGTKNTSYNPQCQGLTKLEYFAGLAMQAMISSTYYADFAKVDNDMKRAVAVNAVEHAKALLQQLEGGEDEMD